MSKVIFKINTDRYQLIGKQSLKVTLLTLFVVFLLAMMLLPLGWALSTSLKTPPDISSSLPQIVPDRPTLENYERLISDRFIRFLSNSLSYTVATILASLLFGGLLAYALARFRFAGKGVILVLILMTLVTPYMAILVPLLFILTKVKLVDTVFVLPLVYTAQTIPFAAWFLKGYFEMIPEDMEQAAMVDGHTRFGAISRILLPLALPGFVTAAIFTALTAWNDYISATFFLNSTKLQTLPVAMFYYLGTHGREWGPLTASAVLTVAPILILFLIFRKYFLGGLLSGAIKG